MCHLVLALPLLALPVLWLLPFHAAAPLYGAVVVLSAAVYILALKAMRMPVSTGAEALLHAMGTVRSVDGGKVTVWVQSELWSAVDGSDALAEGDRVEVVATDGLTLKVRKLAARDLDPGPRADDRGTGRFAPAPRIRRQT